MKTPSNPQFSPFGPIKCREKTLINTKFLNSKVCFGGPRSYWNTPKITWFIKKPSRLLHWCYTYILYILVLVGKVSWNPNYCSTSLGTFVFVVHSFSRTCGAIVVLFFGLMNVIYAWHSLATSTLGTVKLYHFEVWKCTGKSSIGSVNKKYPEESLRYSLNVFQSFWPFDTEYLFQNCK